MRQTNSISRWWMIGMLGMVAALGGQAIAGEGLEPDRVRLPTQARAEADLEAETDMERLRSYLRGVRPVQVEPGIGTNRPFRQF